MKPLLVWILLNTCLPLLPLFLAWGLFRIIRWSRPILAMINDGQLYFFNVALVGVFTFDITKRNPIDPVVILIAIFALIVLAAAYCTSMLLTHPQFSQTGSTLAAADTERLARVSVWVTAMTVIIISSARSTMGLL